MNEKELILTHILGCARHELYALGAGLNLSADQEKKAEEIFTRRKAGEPLQYIFGSSEFMGFKIFLEQGVFIPRPETEILVEEVVSFCRMKKGSFKILELGTGSGCIAVSLAKFLDDVSITAVENDPKAIRIARRNAAFHGCSDKISILEKDFLSLKVNDLPGPFDLVVSNPPYIARDEISGLSPELGYEPRAALDGGQDGLVYYFWMAEHCGAFLKEGGSFFCECGDGQSPAIRRIFEKKVWHHMSFKKDYQGIERIFFAQKY